MKNGFQKGMKGNVPYFTTACSSKLEAFGSAETVCSFVIAT